MLQVGWVEGGADDGAILPFVRRHLYCTDCTVHVFEVVALVGADKQLHR